MSDAIDITTLSASELVGKYVNLKGQLTGELHWVTACKSGWFTIETGGTTSKIRRKQINQAFDVEAPFGEEEEEAPIRSNLARAIQKHRANYRPSVGPKGRKSQSNHDQVAEYLAGMEVDEVIGVAETLLGLAKGELSAKYDHLNPGQKRMNSGNRIRAAIRRGDLEVNESGKIQIAI